MITPREKEVLHKISFGWTTKEIASQLYLSIHTVISHRQSLLEKMEARNVAGLVRKGFERGLLISKVELKSSDISMRPQL